MPVMMQLEHLQGGPPPTAVPVVSVRFRSDDTSEVDTAAPVSLPPDVRAQFTDSVSPGPDPQQLNILQLTPLLFAPGDCAIADAGRTSQEVILISDNQAGVITAYIGMAHSAGTQLVKCSAAVSKQFRLNLMTPPHRAVGNARFWRSIMLPLGVYDQYRINAAYTPGTDVPFTSTAGVPVCGPVPTGYPVVFRSNPVTVLGPWDNNLVEIQWLYTARVVSPQVTDPAQIKTQLQINPANYRWAWDES